MSRGYGVYKTPEKPDQKEKTWETNLRILKWKHHH